MAETVEVDICRHCGKTILKFRLTGWQHAETRSRLCEDCFGPTAAPSEPLHG